MSILSQRIESERKLAGWTKTETAKKLNLPLTTYANYEYGNREPDSATITTMSTLFGVSNDYLMGKSNNRNSSSETQKKILVLLNLIMKTLVCLIKELSRKI